MTRLPRHNPAAWAILEAGFPWLSRMYFKDIHIHITKGPANADRVVFLGNHSSWWDGFLHWRVARRLGLRGRHYTVTLERAIQRSPGLRGLGTIGLEPGSVSGVRRAVRILEGIRQRDRRFSVSIFPQGAIWPSIKRPLDFKSGVAALIRPLVPCTVVPVATHIQPGRHVRPDVFAWAGRPWRAAEPREVAKRSESEVTAALDHLQRLLSDHGEAWSAAWPPSGLRSVGAHPTAATATSTRHADAEAEPSQAREP